MNTQVNNLCSHSTLHMCVFVRHVCIICLPNRAKSVRQLNVLAKVFRKRRLDAGALTLASPEVLHCTYITLYATTTCKLHCAATLYATTTCVLCDVL
jgi:hypothetical protein